MATAHFGLLDEREESELHKSRLLNVEEKPFKRLTKRLVAPGAYTNPSPKKLPTPPPESAAGETQDTIVVATSTAANPDVIALKDDITLDFAAFDSAIARLQFLATANAEERERYAADRLQILSTMENVRESNNQLRSTLESARATLAQRRKFDELADKITSNRMLRSRGEQEVNLAKLAEECEELQRESETYSATWTERRGQFERLVLEGQNLRDMIRDEKEEVERREGMDEDEGAEEGEADQTPGKGSVSGNATPRVDSGAHSQAGRSEDASTPRPDGEEDDSLKPRLDSASRAGSQAPSLRAEASEDVEMGESTQLQTQTQTQRGDTPMVEGDSQIVEGSQEAPQITVEAPAGEGEKMDTT